MHDPQTEGTLLIWFNGAYSHQNKLKKKKKWSTRKEVGSENIRWISPCKLFLFQAKQAQLPHTPDALAPSPPW